MTEASRRSPLADDHRHRLGEHDARGGTAGPPSGQHRAGRRGHRSDRGRHLRPEVEHRAHRVGARLLRRLDCPHDLGLGEYLRGEVALLSKISTLLRLRLSPGARLSTHFVCSLPSPPQTFGAPTITQPSPWMGRAWKRRSVSTSKTPTTP